MRLYPFFIPHAGCPHRCLFCRQEHTTGQDAAPTPGEVVCDLETMLPRGGEGEVAFYGGTFTLLPPAEQRAYLAAVAPFLRDRRVGGVRVSTRPDALSSEAVALLRDGGVTTVEVGCQSFSAEVLRRSGRGHGPQAAGGAVARLREAGLAVGLQLMPGLPGGCRVEAVGSLHRALALKPDFVRIYPAVVLKGAALEAAFDAGHYRPLDLEEAVETCAELLWLCRRHGTPVIRLGLQGTPELDGGQAWVAGPYHPAFGQLVRSRLWRRALERAAHESGGRVARVHPADLADARGHRRSNLEFLQERFGAFSIDPFPDVPRESTVLAGRSFALMDLAGYEG